MPATIAERRMAIMFTNPARTYDFWYRGADRSLLRYSVRAETVEEAEREFKAFRPGIRYEAWTVRS